MRLRFGYCGCIAAALLAPAAGAQVAVQWAGTVVESTGVGDAAAALGDPASPNGVAALDDLGASITVGGFLAPQSYDLAAFAAMLGLGASQLLSYDFLAIDYNGSLTQTFEHSTFVFSDGSDALTFDVVGGNGVVSGGGWISIAVDDALFNGVFGASRAGGVAIVLFDLDGLDVASPGFVATVLRGDGPSPTHAPDVAALGVIVPTPAGGLVIPAWLLLRRRRIRR